MFPNLTNIYHLNLNGNVKRICWGSDTKDVGEMPQIQSDTSPAVPALARHSCSEDEFVKIFSPLMWKHANDDFDMSMYPHIYVYCRSRNAHGHP